MRRRNTTDPFFFESLFYCSLIAVAFVRAVLWFLLPVANISWRHFWVPSTRTSSKSSTLMKVRRRMSPFRRGGTYPVCMVAFVTLSCRTDRGSAFGRQAVDGATFLLDVFAKSVIVLLWAQASPAADVVQSCSRCGMVIAP